MLGSCTEAKAVTFVDYQLDRLTLWLEAYARSLVEPDGPWAGFARATVEDWLEVLKAAQAEDVRDTAAGLASRTRELALLRGALLDLLATGDTSRVTSALTCG